MVSKPFNSATPLSPVAVEGMRSRSFPAVYRKTTRVRFADTDPAGVAYFPKILSYCHAAFEDFFDEALGVPYREVLEDHGVGFPAVHVQIDYAQPLRFGEDVDIQLFIEKVGTKSIHLRYALSLASEPERVAVQCSMVVVTVRLKDFDAIPIPDGLRKRLAARVEA